MKPRVRIPCISVFVGATPDETPASVTSPPAPADAGTLSVSAPNNAETVTATSSRQRIAVTDNSVSLAPYSETAAAVRVQARQITVAADIPDMPEFLKRSADNIAPYARAI